jgi:iron-sulfur cluster insertion protein
MNTSLAYSNQITESEFKLTPAAEEQMAAILSDAEDAVEGIRVFISGGGCGGMTYGMTFADKVTPYDKTLQGDGYKILVDAVALNYLKGCEIDFMQEGLNASFVFNNVFQAVGGSGVCGGCGGGGCA